MYEEDYINTIEIVCFINLIYVIGARRARVGPRLRLLLLLLPR